MTTPKIPGGYVLTARSLYESDVSGCAPVVREVWSYLYTQANFKDVKYRGHSLKRGQLFRTYKEIREALSWNVGFRRMMYTEDEMKKAMKKLRDLRMIDTMKAPGGVLITILNYDHFQNPENYEGTKVAPRRHQGGAIYNKNEENGKKGKKKKEPSPDAIAQEAQNLTIFLAQSILKRDPKNSQLSNGKMNDTMIRWGSDIEKVHRIDGRDWEQIEEVMRWCQEDVFWQTNILSGSKFRKQFDVLLQRMNEQPRKRTSKRQGAIDALLNGEPT